MAALFVALSVYGLVEIREFSDRGALIPRLICWVLILLSAVLLFVNANPKTGVANARIFPFSDVPWPKWWGMVVAFVLFGLAADRFGFYESAFVFLAGDDVDDVGRRDEPDPPVVDLARVRRGLRRDSLRGLPADPGHSHTPRTAAVRRELTDVQRDNPEP